MFSPSTATMKYRFRVFNQSGHTLAEIIVVLMILSILAAISAPRFIDLGATAKGKAFEAALSELNGRESLIWLDIKNSEAGWVDDETLFNPSNYELGPDYRWESSAEIDGGKLCFKDAMVKLSRNPSTAMSPGRWTLKEKKDR